MASKISKRPQKSLNVDLFKQTLCRAMWWFHWPFEGSIFKHKLIEPSIETILYISEGDDWAVQYLSYMDFPHLNIPGSSSEVSWQVSAVLYLFHIAWNLCRFILYDSSYLAINDKDIIYEEFWSHLGCVWCFGDYTRPTI